MSTSISASLISAAASSTTTTSASLVKLANGEYTANSVSKDPKDAAKLGLARLKDGNYGTQSASQVAPSPVAKTSPAVQAALTTLQLGGS